MPDSRTRRLARRRVLSSTLVHTASLAWIAWYCFRNRCHPLALVYVSANTPAGMDPSQSKDASFRRIEACDPELAALYPRSVLVAARQGIDDRARTVREFMRQHGLDYPIVAKPDTGSRSVGAYRVDSDAGLDHLLERMTVDYRIEEYCKGPIEAGLYFLRSPSADRPSRYGIAIKRDACVAAAAPHPGLTPLRTHFLCDDETGRLTPELRRLILAFADTVPFDMGRIDVRARSVEALLTAPRTMQVLEVNVGFTVADLHATDLRHPLTARFRMAVEKWHYAFQRGAVHYAAASDRIHWLEGIRMSIRRGVLMGLMHWDMYRPGTKTARERDLERPTG